MDDPNPEQPPAQVTSGRQDPDVRQCGQQQQEIEPQSMPQAEQSQTQVPGSQSSPVPRASGERIIDSRLSECEHFRVIPVFSTSGAWIDCLKAHFAASSTLASVMTIPCASVWHGIHPPAPSLPDVASRRSRSTLGEQRLLISIQAAPVVSTDQRDHVTTIPRSQKP